MVDRIDDPRQPRFRFDRAASVGVVQKRMAHFDQPLALDSGASLDSFSIAYETYGALNAERSNAILICHALSGDSHVAGYYTDDPAEQPGWWDDAVGPGKMFDTNRFFVICSNVLGGCQGSTGPSSLAPDGKPFALRFPVITIADMVKAQRRLVESLGIQRLFAAAGGSMGGMQALQWAVSYPDQVGAVLFIASTPRSSAQNIALNEIGRQAIYADPNWRGGDYYGKTRPTAGLAVARMVGHISYMSEYSLEAKFSRRLQHAESLQYTFGTEFAVESYLRHQGEKFVQRFDPNSYLYITKALDYFDIGAGQPTIASALGAVCASFLVISFSSDWLYTEAQARELVAALSLHEVAQVEHHHVEAFFGHDSFLVEVGTMTHLVGGYLSRRWEQVMTQAHPKQQGVTSPTSPQR
jgi:homoserine O-acetyltransferase